MRRRERVRRVDHCVGTGMGMGMGMGRAFESAVVGM